MLHPRCNITINLILIASSIGLLTPAASGYIGFGLGDLSPAPTASLTKEQQSALTLQIALVTGPSQSQTPAGVYVTIPQHDVRFMIINHSKQKWEIQSPELYPSQLIIVKPNGEQVKLENDVDVADPAHPGVAPGEMASWTVSINRLFSYDARFKEVGLYRLYWVYGIEHEKAAFRSNDLLIWVDETTPLIDPGTLKVIPRK